MPDRINFDGSRISAKIMNDPVLRCGYHPQASRCGAPTTDILVLDNQLGNVWFPICAPCWEKAWSFHFKGSGARRVQRYRDI